MVVRGALPVSASALSASTRVPASISMVPATAMGCVASPLPEPPPPQPTKENSVRKSENNLRWASEFIGQATGNRSILVHRVYQTRILHVFGFVQTTFPLVFQMQKSRPKFPSGGPLYRTSTLQRVEQHRHKGHEQQCGPHHGQRQQQPLIAMPEGTGALCRQHFGLAHHLAG